MPDTGKRYAMTEPSLGASLAGLPSQPLVLVIDDDPPICQMIAGFLGQAGYRVATAGTGLEALAAIERDPPRLLLIDLNLPELNGWELVDVLRQRGIAIPILVMTAAREAREQAAQIGAAGYVAKPISLPILLRRIDGIMAG
jgi:CheY-like chemotaxis protein